MTQQKTNEVDTGSSRIEKELRAAALDENLIFDNKQSSNSENPEAQTEQPQHNETINTAGNLAFFLSFFFAAGFGALAPAWEITREQSKNLGIAWARVIVKYIPFSLLRYIPNVTGGTEGECLECDALLLTYSTIEPVHKKPRFQEQPERSQKNPEPQFFSESEKNQKEPEKQTAVMREVHEE